jgi:outer membrane immunogenic protein
MLLAGAASAAVISGAHAAGNWQGWYAGANAGYLWADVDSDRAIFMNAYYTPMNLTAVQNASRFDMDDGDSATGGFQAGYNHDFGAWILGAELDFNFANPADTASSGHVLYPNNPGLTFNTTAKFEQDWLSTLRVRLGFEAGSTLIYLTGGGAAADVAVTQGFSDIVLPVPYAEQSRSETLYGWTAGAGVEVPLSDTTSIKLEYLYVDLGDTFVSELDIIPGLPDSGARTTIDVTEQAVRIGLNVKL